MVTLMNNETAKASGSESAEHERLAYVGPELVFLGDVRSLTLGGSGGFLDGGSGAGADRQSTP